MWWIAALLLVGAVYLFLREIWFFSVLMSIGNHAAARGNRRGAIRIYERICAAPSLKGDSAQREAHYNLAWHYLHDKRTSEAIERGRLALRGKLNPAIEALYRMRLADCLEAQGDPSSAVEERRRASELVNTTKEGPAQLIALGASLKKQGRYSEAIPVYERALAKTPESFTMPRTHVMVNLALACWEAGRMNETLRWADAALALNPDLTHRTTALSMSGMALGSLGRLDEAEERHRLAYEASTAAGNADASARHLATPGEMQRRKGRMVEAIETCERAASMSIASRRTARFCEFETFLGWGRFSEAREMLEKGRGAEGFAVPAAERRIQAISSTALALLEIDEGHADRALACLDEARQELEKDEKAAVSYFSMRAWAEALLGLKGESLESARHATGLAAQIPDSRNSLLIYNRNLGCAALAVGDPNAARAH